MFVITSKVVQDEWRDAEDLVHCSVKKREGTLFVVFHDPITPLFLDALQCLVPSPGL